MKVVFIEDVPDVALAGETREVADGYGRNYLLPKKLAVLADSAASNILKAQMKQVLVKRAQAESEMKEIAARLDGAEITIRAKAGEKERLYGSVTGADIAAELGNIAGQAVDKRKIDLEEPIRQLGVREVTLKFTHDITATVKVNVEPEEAAAGAGEKEAKEEKKEKKPRAKKADKEEAGAVAEVEAEAGAEVDAKAGEAGVIELKVDESEVTGEKAGEAGEEVKASEEEVAEVKAEETEAVAEEAAAEVEAEAVAEDTGAGTEETETEKPKARKTTRKKAEPRVEETEPGE